VATKPAKASTPKKTVTTTTSVTNAKHVTTSKTVTTTTGGSSGSRATSPKKAATSAKKVTSPAKFSGPALASRWISGPGGERPMCGVIAVANSLLAALGAEARNAELERLYRAAGGHGDSGAPVPAVLAAVAASGLAGCRLASWRPTSRPAPGGLLLLELDVTPDLHAVACLHGGTVATWGDAVPLTALNARIAGAWDLTWHGEAPSCR
jgi:hypothetical protein